MDLAAAYTQVQERLADVVLDAGIDVETPVPACPDWSVRDVIAHHTGVVADVVSGRALELFGVFTIFDQWRDEQVARARDEMTARQVTERAGRTIEHLVAEWRGESVALRAILRGERPNPVAPYIGNILINDVVVHETDIRAALGLPRAPESAALSLALVGYGFSLAYRLRALGLPAVVVDYAGKERQFGEGEVGARLRADRHELVRVLAGRRTREQIRALDWDGDPGPYLDILSEYGPVDTPTAD